ncbi:Hypothetical predicted protein [Paramuricea clavata]|uniref:Uncharacterized protein n=1 Tax=Paramuricea clavata TaxID=317549 RepID=A0A7D9D8F7_PARCT|nr:Hypothetical predicted protein [Paramuricea clavata]
MIQELLRKIFVILRYNCEVSDGFYHEESSDSDYIPNNMDCTPNRKRVQSDSQSNDEESTSTSQASRQGDCGRGRHSDRGHGRGRARGSRGVGGIDSANDFPMVKRKVKVNNVWDKVDIKCPKAIETYNKYVNAVDCCDQI